MSEIDTNAIMRQIEDEMEPRLQKAADYLAERFRLNLPQDTGATARGVRVINGADRLERIVNIPFPWQFNEFGTANQKANPVGRRTLIAEKDKIISILAGE